MVNTTVVFTTIKRFMVDEFHEEILYKHMIEYLKENLEEINELTDFIIAVKYFTEMTEADTLPTIKNRFVLEFMENDQE